MRSNHRLFTRLIAIIMMFALVLSGCSKQQAASPTESPETTAATTEATAAPTEVTQPTETEPEETEPEVTEPETEPDLSTVDSISVAIYPYLPDRELFMKVLTQQWAELEPDIKLEFKSWDCYSDFGPENIDVVMFDAVFTSYLAEGGYIQPIDPNKIQDADGIIPVAMDGITHNGKTYGIPYLLCSYFLIHYTDDEEISAVDNFEDLCEVLAARTAKDQKDGLLSNFSSNYDAMYLDALMDVTNRYDDFQETPDTTVPNEEAMAILRRIAAVRAKCDDWDGPTGSFSRAEHFNDGHGTAYFGFSEDMAFMGNIFDDITIRTISYSKNGDIPLFYTDISAMGSHVTDPAQKAACLKLMNLVASEKFQLEACVGTEYAQYLLPARESVYLTAAETYPRYSRLHELATNEANRICRFNEDVWVFFEEAYENLKPWG